MKAEDRKKVEKELDDIVVEFNASPARRRELGDRYKAIQRDIRLSGFRMYRHREFDPRVCLKVWKHSVTSPKRNQDAELKLVNMNPDGKMTGDCTTRAMSYALGVDYKTVRQEQFANSMASGFGWKNRRCWPSSLIERGWREFHLPVAMTEASVAKRTKSISGKFVGVTARHAVAFDSGSVVDSYDSRGKRVKLVFAPPEIADKVFRAVNKISA